MLLIDLNIVAVRPPGAGRGGRCPSWWWNHGHVEVTRPEQPGSGWCPDQGHRVEASPHCQERLHRGSPCQHIPGRDHPALLGQFEARRAASRPPARAGTPRPQNAQGVCVRARAHACVCVLALWGWMCTLCVNSKPGGFGGSSTWVHVTVSTFCY